MSINATDRILEVLNKTNDWVSSGEIDRLAKIDRPTYTSRLLARLFDEKKVIRKKIGQNVFYRQNCEHIFLEDTINLKKSKEEKVFVVAQSSELYRELVSDQADTIVSFAFTEMLNNAIEHSRSSIGYVKIWEENGILKFIVRDKGIGVFRNIKSVRKLANEREAIEELLKGKLTTHPSMHSGEGIFWTSKMSDKFMLSSYDYILHIDNKLQDYAIEEIVEKKRRVLGTEVYFELQADSKKSMAGLFSKYSLNHENYSFDTTEIPLKLYASGEFWVSRSQAKRVLAGLDKYKRIILDFKGIDLVGQGFADEIFRVFNIAHPEIILEPVNMNENVRMMVERAINDKTGR